MLLLVLALSAGALAAVPARLGAAEPRPAAGAAEDEPAADEPEDPGDGKSLQLVLDTGGHTAQVTQALFTPDGKDLITVSLDKTVRVWDLATGQTRRVLRPPSTTGSPGSLLAAALSPDGKTLAVSSVVAWEKKPVHQVRLIRLSDGVVERTLDQAPAGAALAFSTDGTRLAASAPGGAPAVRVRVWETATGKAVRDLVLGEAPAEKLVLESVAFSPDGRFLAAGSRGLGGLVRVWDLETGALENELKIEGPVAALAWSADGKSLAASHRYGVSLLKRDGQSLTQVWHRPGRAARFVAFAPDGSQLLHTGGAGGDHVVRNDVVTGKERPGFSSGVDRLTGGALSADGKRVALIGSRPDEVSVWKEDGTLLWRLAGKGDSTALAVWAADGQAVAWTTRPPAGKAEPVFSRSFRLDQLAFGPAVERDFDGAQHKLGTMSLRRTDKLASLQVTVRSQARNIQPLQAIGPFTLLPDQRVALAGDKSGLWLSSTRTGKVLRTLAGHSAVVTSLAARPSGPYLLSAGADQTLRIWNPGQDTTVEKDRPLYPLLSLLVAGNDWVAWTQEGYYAASPGGERLVGWVTDTGPDRMMTFYPAARFRKRLYRPDVVKLALEKGSVAAALKDAKAEAPDVEQLLPPRAALEVVDRSAVPKVKVKAAAEAAARGQPVQSLRLLVDGRPLPDGQGVLELKEGQAKAEAVWEVELPPGQHELKALARGPDTAGVSPAVPLDVPTAPAGERPTLRLIAVGVDEYPAKSLRLNCPVADAKGLAQAFGEHCAGKDNLFGDARATTLLDAQATRGAVRGALKDARQAVKPGDLLVFSFAGHGAKQGKKFYLLTVDADPGNLAGTALSGDDLRAALADMPCQVLLLLDACHSAAGVRAFTPATDDAARDMTDDECGVAVLCAAMGYEEAQEKDGHGLFSKAVIEALGRADRVPYNYRDGRQYVHHLGAFVLDEVQAASHDEQHPFLTMPYVTESFPLRRLPQR
jgi:Tol biopolymer transport system component